MAEEIVTTTETEAPAVETVVETKEQTEQPQEKLYTASEMISEIDRRVTQAVNKVRKEYDRKLSLNGLGEAERAKAEADQQIADLRAELEEAKVTARKYEVAKEFAARELPASLVDLISLTGESAEVKERIDMVDKAFKDAVQAAVAQRISGKGIPSKGIAGKTIMSKDDFRKLSITQQNELLKTDPETYRILTER